MSEQPMPSARRGPLAERPPQGLRVDPPAPDAPTVHLDHRYQVAQIVGGQSTVAVADVDVDLGPRRAYLHADVPHQGTRIVAQVAVDPAVQDDPRLTHVLTVGHTRPGTLGRLAAALGFPNPARVPVEPARTADGAVAAFFDVDNTLVRGATLFQLAVALGRRGFVTRRDLTRFTTHQLRYLVLGEHPRHLDDLRARALSLLAGHDAELVSSVAREVCDHVLAERLYPGTLAILAAHRAAGHQVWLVTATPIEVGQPIADRLGATGCLATVAERADGRYTGRLVGRPVHGPAKATAVTELAMRLGLDLATSYAYGDSASDLAILSAVGHPCAINADPRLRRHALADGWPCYDFRSGRRAMRRALLLAALAGIGWAATAGIRAARGRPGAA